MYVSISWYKLVTKLPSILCYIEVGFNLGGLSCPRSSNHMWAYYNVRDIFLQCLQCDLQSALYMYYILSFRENVTFSTYMIWSRIPHENGKINFVLKNFSKVSMAWNKSESMGRLLYECNQAGRPLISSSAISDVGNHHSGQQPGGTKVLCHLSCWRQEMNSWQRYSIFDFWIL